VFGPKEKNHPALSLGMVGHYYSKNNPYVKVSLRKNIYGNGVFHIPAMTINHNSDS